MTTLTGPTPFYGGGQVRNPANVLYSIGAPAANSGLGQRLGTIDIDTQNQATYMLVGETTWQLLAASSGGMGSFTTLTSTGATTLATTGASTNTFGNTTGATSVGILAGSGGINLTGATAITGATTIVGATSINASGSAITTINTGGTGATNIGNATGNTAVTGSLTASTTLTATSGAITATAGDFIATNGNLQLQTLGNKLEVKAGTTGFAGTGTLSSGTVQINNTNIATGDIILLTSIAANGSTTFGVLSYTISNAASFTVTSLILGTPGSTQTADASTFAYLIVRPL